MTNSKKKALFTWLGDGDMSNSIEGKELGGAIAQAVDFYAFSEVHLFNGQDYSRKLFIKNGNSHNREETAEIFIDKLKKKIGNKLIVKRVNNFNPIDYNDICNHLIPYLHKKYKADNDNYFLQTSGTPSTAVVWILLAQTTFPAKLLQTSIKRGAEEISLPFNVFADFIPRIQDPLLTEIVTNEKVSDSAIVHECQLMKNILAKADQVALHNVPVLLLGESGTGKELFAERIHRASGRTGKLIKVNCGAIPTNLLESELFGAKKGSFTGAERESIGKFEAAKDGTIFLDEIGEMPLDMQVKILRVLQEGTIAKVGATEERKIDIRVIAATNRNIMESVANGNFREDLFYRLAVAVLQIPPLRERENDVCLIAEYLLDDMNEESKKIAHYKCKKFHKNVKFFMKMNNWHGNIRELGNTIRRVCVWKIGQVITANDLQEATINMPSNANNENLLNRPFNEDFNLQNLMDELEKYYIKKTFTKTAGNKTAMAKLLGIKHHQTITDRLKKYGIK